LVRRTKSEGAMESNGVAHIYPMAGYLTVGDFTRAI
jgi:hypothetical protein